jgi:DNA-binding transcriptional ArsR family regulator
MAGGVTRLSAASNHRKPGEKPGRSIATTGEEAVLDDIFGALSDPIRRGIIGQLRQGSCSVTQLGAPFAVSAPAISKHLAVLERSGLIVRWKAGRVHYCRLVADPLAHAGTWIEQHRTFWERQLEALADYLDGEEDPCRQTQVPTRQP